MNIAVSSFDMRFLILNFGLDKKNFVKKIITSIQLLVQELTCP